MERINDQTLTTKDDHRNLERSATLYIAFSRFHAHEHVKEREI